MFQPRHHPADSMQTWRNFLQIIRIASSCFSSTSPSKETECLDLELSIIWAWHQQQVTRLQHNAG